MSNEGGADLREATYTLRDGDGTVLGVAFRAPVAARSGSRGSFLLTAAHTVRHLHLSGLPVDVVSGGARELVRGSIEVCGLETQGDPDVALVSVPEWLGRPLRCVKEADSGRVVIRGAPAGASVEQATLRGRTSGREWQDGEEVIDILVEDLVLLERVTGEELAPSTRSLAYASLRGISGGAVQAQDAAGPLGVIGVVVKRNTAGLANRIYALPIETVQVFLADHGFQLSVDRRPVNDHAVGAVFMGHLVRSLLGTPGGGHLLWEEASQLFYTGVPVDLVLADMAAAPKQYGIEDDLALGQVEFLLSRLLLKRGRKADAARLLNTIQDRAARGTSPDHVRLAALVRLRRVIELSENRSLIPGREAAVFHSLGSMADLEAASEEERAYELASAAGREAILLSVALPRDPELTGRYFRRLAEMHESLQRQFPSVLQDKQEIVGIALQMASALNSLQGIDGKERLAHLASLAEHGRAAAIQRENGIFGCHTLLIESIVARGAGEETRAFCLALTSAEALRRAGLRLSHEGIGSIFAYLRHADPPLAALVQSVHVHGVIDGVAAFLATNALLPPLSAAALQRALIDSIDLTQDLTRVSDVLRIVPGDLL